MADEPKMDEKGGGFEPTFATVIGTLESMIAGLQEQIRPIQQRIAVLEALLQDKRDKQFLVQRRQGRAAERQSGARPANSPVGEDAFRAAS